MGERHFSCLFVILYRNYIKKAQINDRYSFQHKVQLGTPTKKRMMFGTWYL